MVLGIVCEYNPFHRGHLHHLRACREAAGEDSVIVCVMSGDFVQRGDAAVFSKFARAEAACRCGADLVVELPLPWCLSSAEGFARGAVGLLATLGVGTLGFGSESGDAAALEELAALLCEDSFIEAVKARMSADATLSFPAARQREAEARIGERALLLGQPNDILGAEYCKAIRLFAPLMRPLAIPRLGSAHDGIENTGGPLSASALRVMLAAGQSIDEELPPEAAAVFRRERGAGRELCAAASLETALLSRMRRLDESAYLSLPDAADGLGRRLCRAVREEATLTGIQNAVRSKRYPLARVRRLCLCAALDIRAGMADGIPPYARVLAAGERGRKHLRNLSEDASLPLLTKPAAVRRLSADSQRLFSLGASAHDLYVLGYSDPEARLPGQDWRTGPYLEP